MSDHATMTGISNASPAVVTTSTPHTITTGQEFMTTKKIVGMVGPGGETLLNHRFKAGAVTTTTVECLDKDTSVPFDTSAWTPYVSGGTLLWNYPPL